MGYQISVAMTSRVHLLEPVGIAVDISCGDRIFASEWRVADDGIEPRVRPVEHLGEFDTPMEGVHAQLRLVLEEFCKGLVILCDQLCVSAAAAFSGRFRGIR